MEILIIIAGEGKNLELAKVFQSKISEANISSNILNLVELSLPLYTSRAEKEINSSDLLKNEIPLITNASGLIFVAPEYNGGIPPVLTNFIAWVSRSTKDWRQHFNGKPGAIASFSGGGGLHLLTSLRSQLAYVGMNVLGRQIQAHMGRPVEENSIESVVKELIRISQLTKS